jgi:hypothetical protein
MIWGTTQHFASTIEATRVHKNNKLVNFVILAIGAILPLASLLVFYAFQPHGLEQLYYSVIRFNLDVYSGIDVPKAFFTIGRGPIYIVGAAGLFFLLRQKNQPIKIFLPLLKTIQSRGAAA